MTSSVANPNGLREATADRNTVSHLLLPFNFSRDNNNNKHSLVGFFFLVLLLCSIKKKGTNFFSVKLTGDAERGCIWDSDGTIIFNRIYRSEVTSRTAAY